MDVKEGRYHGKQKSKRHHSNHANNDSVSPLAKLGLRKSNIFRDPENKNAPDKWRSTRFPSFVIICTVSITNKRTLFPEFPLRFVHPTRLFIIH